MAVSEQGKLQVRLCANGYEHFFCERAMTKGESYEFSIPVGSSSPWAEFYVPERQVVLPNRKIARSGHEMGTRLDGVLLTFYIKKT